MNVSVSFTMSSRFCSSLATTSLMNWTVMMGMPSLLRARVRNRLLRVAHHRRPGPELVVLRRSVAEDGAPAGDDLPVAPAEDVDDLDVHGLVAVGALAPVACDV